MTKTTKFIFKSTNIMWNRNQGKKNTSILLKSIFITSIFISSRQIFSLYWHVSPSPFCWRAFWRLYIHIYIYIQYIFFDTFQSIYQRFTGCYYHHIVMIPQNYIPPKTNSECNVATDWAWTISELACQGQSQSSSLKTSECISTVILTTFHLTWIFSNHPPMTTLKQRCSIHHLHIWLGKCRNFWVELMNYIL